MEAVAKLRNAKGSARKSRLLADMIRGKDAYSAMNMLRFSAQGASESMEKLVQSAIYNWAARNPGARPEDSELYVKEVRVDGGKMLKRWNPAPRGMAHRIRKRSNHVTIVIDSRVVVDDAEPNMVDADEAVEIEEEIEE